MSSNCGFGALLCKVGVRRRGRESSCFPLYRLPFVLMFLSLLSTLECSALFLPIVLLFLLRGVVCPSLPLVYSFAVMVFMCWMSAPGWGMSPCFLGLATLFSPKLANFVFFLLSLTCTGWLSYSYRCVLRPLPHRLCH